MSQPEEALQPPAAAIEEFLNAMIQQGVALGYICDQYMRREVTFGDVTLKMGIITTDIDRTFSRFQPFMAPDQLRRFQLTYQGLESMNYSLIETEYRRTREMLQESLRKGEFFQVTVGFESMASSIHVLYDDPTEDQKRDRGQRLAELQRDKAALLAGIEVIKTLAADLAAGTIHTLPEHLKTYAQAFPEANSSLCLACHDRLLTELRTWIASSRGDERAARYLTAGCESLRGILSESQGTELQSLCQALKPPDPEDVLRQLYEAVLGAEGEANVYSAVVAFNNFAQTMPTHPHVQEHKRSMKAVLHQKGYM